MAMHTDIDQALHQSHDLFSPKPQWLMLATVHGEAVKYIGQPDVAIELDRISALAAAAAGHHERLTTEYNLGTPSYGVTIGGNGLVIMAFIGTNWVLVLKFQEASTNVLMNTLRVLPTIIYKLLQPDSGKGA